MAISVTTPLQIDELFVTNASRGETQIVLDVLMPVRDGYEVATELRRGGGIRLARE